MVKSYNEREENKGVISLCCGCSCERSKAWKIQHHCFQAAESHQAGRLGSPSGVQRPKGCEGGENKDSKRG